jgi:hypothetical protein
MSGFRAHHAIVAVIAVIAALALLLNYYLW